MSQEFLAHRRSVIDYVISIHGKTSASPATLWLGVFVADQYIWENKSDLNDDEAQQLIAVSSLLIASEVHDPPNPINCHVCAYLMKKGPLTKPQIEIFSNDLRTKRLANPSIVTAIQHIDVYLQAIFTHAFISSSLEKYEIPTDLIRSLAYFHAERNLFDPSIAWQKPNLVAIASLKTAFFSAFLNPNPPAARSPSNSIDSSAELISILSSSQDEFHCETDFIPLSDALSTRSTSLSDASFRSARSESADPKRSCLEEIIDLLAEISCEESHLIHETSVLIAKNVNSDFCLILHPSSPQFDPNMLLSPAPQLAKSIRKGRSPSPSLQPIAATRSLSETHLPTVNRAPTEAQPPPPARLAMNPPIGFPSRTRSVSAGYIYGLKAYPSVVREKYSQMRFHRVADIVIPLFE
jgi:hypothetical protein